MSKPITLIIPIKMTAAQIIRANPALENEALALAEELHAIIDAARERYVNRYPYDPDYAFELEDLIDAVRRTVLGFWPTGKDASGNESMWLMEQLFFSCNASDLYDRYLRLCERVSGERLAA